MKDVFNRRHWIFDMDGTLTVAIHDFDAIRAELGLPAGRPILEALDELPEAEASEIHRRLDAIELELARRAQPAQGAVEFVGALHARGDRIGILTRNTHENAWVTLSCCRLDRYFDPSDVLGREAADPKPSPAGIRALLEKWNAEPDDAVMVGDFRFDLEAGRAARTATLYVAAGRDPEWDHLADHTVAYLEARLLGDR